MKNALVWPVEGSPTPINVVVWHKTVEPNGIRA